jgi:acyl dehydratase
VASIAPSFEYRVRAVNSDLESENRIHADGVASGHGFRGALVPGVNVYGYLTVPMVRQFGAAWLDHSYAHVRFVEPVYDGEEVVVSTESRGEQIQITATAGKGSVRALMASRMEARLPNARPAVDRYSEYPLPSRESRPAIERAVVQPGTPLGSLSIAISDEQARVLSFMNDATEQYRGSDGAAHPTLLLGLANRLLTSNFVMTAWIHTESEIRTWSAVRANETVSVRGSISDRFDRRGHEFLVADIALLGADGRLCQQIKHTAIYKLRGNS